jgi:hypothetical protein
LSDQTTSHDTLLSDVDTSIKFFYGFDVRSNSILVIASVLVIAVPILTASDIISSKWGFLAALCGALLAWLGLGAVSANFIKARNDLQIANYHFYTDHDRGKLIAAYEKAKALASYVPSVPAITDKGPPPEPINAKPAEKSP